MLPRLLYIGNKLSGHGRTLTGIEILGPCLEQGGFEIRYASSQKSKALRMAHMVAAVLRSRRWADYVLIDTYSTQNFWYAYAVSVLCRKLKLRYIPILHGGNLPGRLKSDPRICREIFGGAFANVAPTPYLRDAFRAAGFDAALVPNPFSAEPFPFKQRTAFGPRLLWVRSLAGIYDPAMALRVMEELMPDYDDAILHLVGPDRGLGPALESYASERGLRVVFHGKLRQAQWAALARDCDIFINTSTADNAPFSLIEAAALGLPIVSTNVGGIPHLFGPEQITLVDPGDSAAMAHAIRHIIENPEHASGQVHAALATVAGSMWPKVLGKWLEILK